MDTGSFRLVLARNIRFYRWKKKFTQEMLAARLGRSRQWVCAAENGKVALNSDQLECLGRVLEVHMGELLGSEDLAKGDELKEELNTVKIFRTNV